MRDQEIHEIMNGSLWKVLGRKACKVKLAALAMKPAGLKVGGGPVAGNGPGPLLLLPIIPDDGQQGPLCW